MKDAPQIAQGWQNWITGGVLERADWKGPDGRVTTYMGESVPTTEGDTLVLLRTAVNVQVVTVER